MFRDLSISKTDADGYLSYKMLPSYQSDDMRMRMAERFAKLLLSDRYGGFITEARINRTRMNVSECLRKTDDAMKSIAASNYSAIYTLYEGYTIKSLDINPATATIQLELELMLKGGDTVTLTL